MKNLTKIFLFVLSFLYIVNSTKILLIIENNNIKNSHSIFINMVKELGNVELTIKESKDKGLELFEYGEAKYDNLILLAPSLDLSTTKLDVDSLLYFIDVGKNVFFVGDETLSKDLREVASECGVVFDESGKKVIDHFHSLNSSSSTTTGTGAGENDSVFSASNLLPLSSLFSPSSLSSSSLLYDGVAFKTESSLRPLHLDVLVGNPTSYTGNVGRETTLGGTGGEGGKGLGTGRELVLISTFQARNNARVVFVGSVKMLSDSFLLKKQFNNKNILSDLLHWNFQLKSVLRYSNLNHHRDGDSLPPSTPYVIKENLSYSVVIEELSNGKWVPFVSDEVELEFQMLDPYVRTYLKNDGKGLFYTTFLIPDVYGIFTLKLELESKGYTFINEKTIVSVRPLRHNEYERFVIAAYPYYAGSLSMIFGAVFLGIIFLFSDTRK
eukprot:TRINITY_DN295_c0_g1_i1.p1 TRINITY_DN295_c0_g1~~TRINITY_DN295_c0_g1_i1.p1  ORF type:complete len:449 (+),score=148.76 TRINITY_DN295_c0_g1_i1:32-1348(+)